MRSARTWRRHRHHHHRILTLLIAVTLTVLPGCHPQTTTPEPAASIDLAPFKQMARTSDCADVRNRLFLIDGSLVFWDRASHCADASYAQALYGGTVDRVLCRLGDSIAGPQRGCPVAGYSAMFDTIIAHLDEPDLGLGKAHRVEPIPF